MYLRIVLLPDVDTSGLPVVIPEYLAVGIDKITTPSGYITAGDLLKIRAGISSQMQNNLHYWRTAGGVNTRVDVNIDITDIKLEIIPNSNTQPIGGFVTMNQYVPVKIKQSDFVKSVFQMYNLYVDVDPNQPNNIILTHRDEYYDNGAQKDWTYKLAKDRDGPPWFTPDRPVRNVRGCRSGT